MRSSSFLHARLGDHAAVFLGPCRCVWTLDLILMFGINSPITPYPTIARRVTQAFTDSCRHAV